MEQQRKITYIDIGNCTIDEAYIKIGRPDLGSLYRRENLIWNIGIGIILVSAAINIALLFSKLS